jgi:hypothetical protein
MVINHKKSNNHFKTKNKIKMNKKNMLASIAILIGSLSTQHSYAQDQPNYQGSIGKTLNDSKEWWAPVVKAPA